MRELWERLRFYLLIWLLILLALCVISVIRYWAFLVEAISSTFWGIIYMVSFVVIIILAIRTMFRSLS